MKKTKIAMALSILILTALVLTSCEVHFGNNRAYVQWYVIAVPVIVFVIACLVIAGVILSKNTYVCPECGKRFHPKWYRAMLTPHINSDRVLKCPHCGKKSLCRKED